VDEKDGFEDGEVVKSLGERQLVIARSLEDVESSWNFQEETNDVSVIGTKETKGLPK
jgi:hypothetical protein